VQEYDARDRLETGKLSDKESTCTDIRKAVEKELITPGQLKKTGETDGGKQKLQAEVLQQIEDKQRGDLTGSKATSQTGMEQPFREKFKVQPLPVGPLQVGQKEKLGVIPRSQSAGKMYQGMDSGKKKLQTEAVQPFKEKLKVRPQQVGPLQVGQKEKLNITPRSQSTGKIFKGGAAAEKMHQTQAVQQNKFKANYQRWGTSAGSSEAFRAPR
jgi:hypothetical protein